MKRGWSIHYTAVRYMGEGIEVLVSVPVGESAPMLHFRKTVTDWDVPTLDGSPDAADRKLPLSPARAQSLYDSFAAARVGAVPPIAVTIDRGAHTLVFLGGSNRVEFHWSLDLPPQWKTLEPVIAELSQLAKEAQ